jgi:hypothetical protein
MKFLNQILSRKRQMTANFMLAQQQAVEELKQLRFVRAMLPVSIEETPDMVIINRNIFIRCYVLGVQRGLRPGFPVQIRDGVLEELSMLSSENSVISYAFELVPISTSDSLDEAEKALYAMNCSLQETKDKDPNLVDISLGEDRDSTIAAGKRLHKGEKHLSATTILTVTTKDLSELAAIEIIIDQILQKYSIEYDIPKFQMMEAYRASLMLPVRAEDFAVELLPDYASQLVCLSNPNSSTSETGYLVGIDRFTNKQIIVDPEVTLHATYIGATGCGKTVTMLTHLSRAMSILGMNGVFISPKKDSITDFRNLAHEFGDMAAIVDIGRYGQYNINPLQIIYRGEPDEYTYSSHLGLILQFFNALFSNHGKDTGSGNMDNEIVMTVRDLYTSRGILKSDPKTWENAAWPNLSDLHQYWIQLSKKDPGNLSLKALISKTAMVDEMWSFLNKPTNCDLTKQFLVFDLSGCPSDIKDAVNVFCVGLLMQMFSKRVDGDNGTIVCCDEAGTLLKSAPLAQFIIDILRLGRSAKLTGFFGTQSVEDFKLNPDAAAQFKANIFQNYIFGKNMRPENIAPTQNYFQLSDREVKWLTGNNPGDCIARIDMMTVPIRNVLTDWEKRVILDSNPEQKTLLKTESGSVFSLVHSGLKELVNTHGIILAEWTKEAAFTLAKLGYTSRNIQHCIGGGRHNVWVRNGIMDSNNMIGNQHIEHKGSVLEIAGELVQYGLPVELNEHEGVDVSTSLNGDKIAFEFELSKKSPQVLAMKLQKALETHAEVYFICTSANKEDITEVVGASNTIPRGKDFAEFLKERLSSTKTLSDVNIT